MRPTLFSTSYVDHRRQPSRRRAAGATVIVRRQRATHRLDNPFLHPAAVLGSCSSRPGREVPPLPASHTSHNPRRAATSIRRIRALSSILSSASARLARSDSPHPNSALPSRP